MLSTESGAVEMAYAGARPWHGLGVQVPGLMKTEEALTAARLDWSVEKVPALSSFDMTPIPGAHAVLRTDTHRPLGVVGDRYTVIPNKDAFAFFDGVLGEGQGQIETAAALGHGERVFMMARLPETVEVVKGDAMESFLLVSTSHDGSSNTEVLFTNVRVVCQNTLTAALRGAKNVHKVRHTTNWKDRMAEAQKTLVEARSYWGEIRAAAQHLAATSVTRVEVGAFLEAMFPKKEDAKRTGANDNARARVAELMETGRGTNIPGVKGTAWGLLNAYTEWLQYDRTVKGLSDGSDAQRDAKRWENIAFGPFQNDMQKAMDTLLAVA
jgi:phage/plasmid-like protein (TIGR03299 family)